MADSSLANPDAPVSHAVLLLLGPVFVGALTSWFLYGISCVQLYLYHVSPYNDRGWIQFTVYSIFVLDTLHTVVGGFMGWGFLCSGWGRPSVLTFPGWTFVSIPIISGIVSAWVQIFYAWRIYILKRWKIMPILIILLALMQGAGGIATGIGVAFFDNVVQIHLLESRIDVWLAGSAAVDTIITVSMIYLLYSARRNSIVSSRGEKTVNRLIRLSVETGFATTTTAVLELGMFFWTPNANFYVLLSLVLCKVYSNALMTSLNSRALASRTRAVSFGESTVTTAVGGAVASFGGTPRPGMLGQVPARHVETFILPPAVVHVSSNTEVFGTPGASPAKTSFTESYDVEMASLAYERDQVSADGHYIDGRSTGRPQTAPS